jgi:hypothetical protein
LILPSAARTTLLNAVSTFPYVELSSVYVVIDYPLNYTSVETQMQMDQLLSFIYSKDEGISPLFSSFWVSSFLTYARTAHFNETIDSNGDLSRISGMKGYIPSDFYYGWLNEFFFQSSSSSLAVGLGFEQNIIFWPNQTIRASSLSIVWSEVVSFPKTFDLVYPLTAQLTSEDQNPYYEWDLYVYTPSLPIDELDIMQSSWPSIIFSKALIACYLIARTIIFPSTPKSLQWIGITIVITESFSSTAMIIGFSQYTDLVFVPAVRDLARKIFEIITSFATVQVIER